MRAAVATVEAKDMVSFGEPGADAGGFVLEIVRSLRAGDTEMPGASDLPVIAGPIARAVQALAGSDRLIESLMGKTGYVLVKVPPGIAAALSAEYVLAAKIEQTARIASFVPQRRVSQVLAAGEAGRALVERARKWSDDARDWPEVLVQQLVDVHAVLALQAVASNRMRDLVLDLSDPDGGAAEEKSLAAKPASGDAQQAGAELAAGYEAHASAAQVAAARLEHSLAHGDEATAIALLSDLAGHLDDLRDHHRILTEFKGQQGQWQQCKWATTVQSIVDGYTPLVERLSSGGSFILGTAENGEPELRAIPTARAMAELRDSQETEAVGSA